LQLTELLSLWLDDQLFASLLERMQTKSSCRVEYHGIDGSAGDYFISALGHLTGRPLILITADQAGAEKAYTNINAFLPGRVKLLPARELFVSPSTLSRSEEIQHQRLQFLQWLNDETGGIYILPLAALLSRNLPPVVWQELILIFNCGATLQRENLIADLVDRGYERSSLTETAGQFSARGDIVDIFSPGLGRPVRLELFDDRLESIRFFDPLNQRSKERVSVVSIMPARELILGADRYREGEKLIRDDLKRATSKLRKSGDAETAARLNQQVGRHLERLANPEGLDLLSGYFSYFYGSGVSLLDYLPRTSLLVVEETALLQQKERALKADLDQYLSDSYAEGALFGKNVEQLWSLEELFARYSGQLVALNAIAAGSELPGYYDSFSFDIRNAPLYHGQWELFGADLQNWHQEGYQVYLAADTDERVTSLTRLVEELLPAAPACISLSSAPDQGFVIPSLQVALITERNLMPGRKKKRRIRSREGTLLGSYRELATGDYVVHEQHGIGQFQGIQTLKVGGIERDYLLLKYRGTDKLYIPIDQVGLIRKYSGGDGPAPRLHSLGGAEWQRLKKRVNQSVEELARELLELYAARETVGGYRFGPDHPWQQEFETQFPYEETQDQLQAIVEVKADLEKGHPMDRLICGDVGYGKTEVAMRAAFKVVMEGKQVAVLVPTTVLAQQHFLTFQERFNGFPVRIAQLSRFISTSKQKELLKEIAAGKIDIIIGTHRLLSGDLHFHDLGLLIVDEEQRFGVRQKEKIKQMRLEVDILSMTATPIPRTLHLSLAGARDLSIIDTPPEDRYPIQTYVLEYSENLVREVVQRELNRQGQVFIVFNKVAQIDAYAGRIKQLFPSVALAVGHGQMPEAKLEKVMLDFQAGRYQILVSSTIIESGLDIPNVNTLIVCDADRFGLAQLYQIRGRVGRSNRLAYAYLTYRKDKLINETARKRLKAIREFTELGSGFKIALRDLEIRGAGNILGAEQHGFIAAVGFDMYIKLLDQAVAVLKNQKVELKPEPRLDLQVSAYLPSSYIPAQDQRIDIYQKIYGLRSIEELTDLEEELIDRYATPPDSVKMLLQIAMIKLLAEDLGVDSLTQKQRSTLVQFLPGSALEGGVLTATGFDDDKKYTIVGSNPLCIKIALSETGEAYLVSLINDLNRLAERDNSS
jgi:transcription-repair coupling factor (superfamily II helicase)